LSFAYCRGVNWEADFKSQASGRWRLAAGFDSATLPSLSLVTFYWFLIAGQKQEARGQIVECRIFEPGA